MSQRREKAIAFLPEEHKADDTILTKKHFERLGPEKLDGHYIRETLEEIALENFLILAEKVIEKQYKIMVKKVVQRHLSPEGHLLFAANTEEEAILRHILSDWGP